ncbi:MAG: glycosyltransferase family 2 protein [Candidatus Bipolaricaulota bacterium]|nr:glycosyltransferase family 2 protein [Candidatus Bipolaricaulota bacterium]MDW8126197.1 glycosyltransferase family A protein [Candidatus Bipolaricaulota bacterium]
MTVVVPVLNEEDFLEETLRSLRHQTFRDFELIVVDNGSTDASIDIAQQFADRVVIEPQKGYDFALHRGILEAQSPLIAQADADTLYPRDWLSKMVRALDNSGVVCAYGPWAFRENPKWRRHLELSLCWSTQLITHLFGFPLATGCNMGFRREAYFRVGGYPALNHLAGADTRLGLRLRQVGKVRFVPDMIAYTSNRVVRQQGVWRRWALTVRVLVDILMHRDQVTLDQWYDWRRS